MTAILRAHILSVRSTQLRFLVRGTKGSYTKYGGDVQESQLKTLSDPPTDIHSEWFGREPESLWGLVETVADDDQITTNMYVYVRFSRQNYLMLIPWYPAGHPLIWERISTCSRTLQPLLETMRSPRSNGKMQRL